MGPQSQPGCGNEEIIPQLFLGFPSCFFFFFFFFQALNFL
jgi:hypothetical protein